MTKHASVILIITLFAFISVRAENELDREFVTNVYVVPPTFLSTGGVPVGSQNPLSARKILEGAGIFFPEGASASYTPATSYLVVRNTLDQLELVEAYLDSINSVIEKQIYITVTEVEFDKKPADELGFNNLPEWKKTDPGRRARTFPEHDQLLEELSRPPRTEWPERSVVRAGVVGALTDPQFQVTIRAIKQKFGVDVLTHAPSIMVRSGQSALIQVGGKRWGVDAVLGVDEFTIDLRMYLPIHGEALFPNDPDSWRNTFQETIKDGQVIVWAEEKSDDTYRIVFTRAQILDPAGLPVNKSEEIPFPRSNPAIDKLLDGAAAELTPAFSTEQQRLVKEADEHALRGSQLLADGDFKAAVLKYRAALDLLPEHEMTAPRRKAYEEQLLRARYALMPEGHSIHTVRKGESLYDIARRYDLSVDALKKVNKLRSDTLEVGQLLAIPGGEDKVSRVQSRIESALKEIIIPTYHIEDVPFSKAIGLIQVAVISNFDSGLFPEEAPRFVFKDIRELADTKISLKLANVPAAEALRYVTQLASCKYSVQDDQIIITRL